MQKNKNIVFLILFYFCMYSVLALDKVGLHCINISNKDNAIIYFNHGKAFYLEKFYFDNEYIISDENIFLKKNKNLGNHFLKKDKFLYWDKNPWNNSYKYQLELESLKLSQKFVIKKSMIGRVKANFFNESEYYVEVIKFKCRILNNWDEVEKTFNKIGRN